MLRKSNPGSAPDRIGLTDPFGAAGRRVTGREEILSDSAATVHAAGSIQELGTGCAPHHDRPLYLYSLPFLPATAGEPVAGSRRTPGFRLSLSRLERTHHGGVLCAQCRVAHS